MSLIQDPVSLKRKQILPVDEEPEEERKILNPVVLVEMAKHILSGYQLEQSDLRKCKDHRARTLQQSWRLQNLLGRINEENWDYIVKAQLQGMINRITHEQTNGQWELSLYEVDIRRGRAGEERLVVAVRLVDTLGNEDVRYVDGIEASTIKVENALNLPAELLERMGAGDDELKSLVKTLIATLLAKETGRPLAEMLGAAGAAIGDEKEAAEDEESPFSGPGR